MAQLSEVSSAEAQKDKPQQWASSRGGHKSRSWRRCGHGGFGRNSRSNSYDTRRIGDGLLSCIPHFDSAREPQRGCADLSGTPSGWARTLCPGRYSVTFESDVERCSVAIRASTNDVPMGASSRESLQRTRVLACGVRYAVLRLFAAKKLPRAQFINVSESELG